MSEILSMTGYGSAKGTVDELEITVELKSVNNRYLDCSVRLPRGLLFAEETVKQTVSAGVGRGKVDVFINAGDRQDGAAEVSVDVSLARGYYDAVKTIAAELGIETGLNALAVARMPDVLTVEKRELDRDRAARELADVTGRAVAEFNVMRGREGLRLKRDILEKLECIERFVAVVEERSPQTVAEYRQRLEARLREVLEKSNPDEQRLVTEVAIFADRTAVDEETVRLRSHIAQLRLLLEAGSPAGRKMDFLIQEFNREANTIGSKCSDAALSRVVVDLKSEIEKIREQVQNIE